MLLTVDPLQRLRLLGHRLGEAGIPALCPTGRGVYPAGKSLGGDSWAALCYIRLPK